MGLERLSVRVRRKSHSVSVSCLNIFRVEITRDWKGGAEGEPGESAIRGGVREMFWDSDWEERQCVCSCGMSCVWCSFRLG